MGSYRVVNSEFVKWAKSYDGPRFSACLCDPPYGLEFMGREWDAPHKATSFPKPGNIGGFADGEKPSFARQKTHLWKLMHIFEEWGDAMIPLLHPGAPVLMFGGTRTFAYVSVGMQMAGFEQFDTLCWLHGQGFPKAQDISKLIDKAAISAASAPWAGYKTCALKPAWEPVICFRAPTGGRNYAELALEFGSGCLNVDGGRIGLNGEQPPEGSAKRIYRNNEYTDEKIYGENTQTSPLGRYPANVAFECICEHTELVDANDNGHFPKERQRGGLYEFGGDEGSSGETAGGERHMNGKAVVHTNPDCPCAILDAQSGEQPSGGFPERRHSDITRGIYGRFEGQKDDLIVERGRTFGTASRFFYTAKASASERHGFNEADPKTRNGHPTVKPIDLTTWLATMLCPPESVKPRRLLVPFMGSGSELIGGLLGGWDEVVGVEQDKEYCDLVDGRVEHHVGLFAQKLA